MKKKSSPSLLKVARAIAAGDDVDVTPELAAARFDVDVFFDEITHQTYVGDTLLHVAAASYAVDVAKELIKAGADVHATNRRGAEPLHYACDGNPDSDTWSPKQQAAMIKLLLKSGANPDALDKSGVAPLHRATRTRSTAAVKALLEGGADPNLRNKSGTSALELSGMTTGKSGSGSEAAKREQAAIAKLLKDA